MSSLIRFWISHYFTDLLLTITLFLVFIMSLIKGKNHPQYRFFPIYFFSFIILQLLNYSYFIISNDDITRKKIIWVSMYADWLVTLIEFLAFTYFFYSVIKHIQKIKLIRWVFLTTTFITIIIVVFDTFNKRALSHSSISTIYILESLSIILFCFLYYHELFSVSSRANLLHDTSFWTATGLTFYSLCTLPATFVLNYYIKLDYLFYAKIFTIIHVFYLLLFAMIIKSFSCKTPRPI